MIVAGPNGAGKSTSAPALLRDQFGPIDYVNADVIALGLSGFRPANVALEAGRIMLERLHGLAEQKVSFAFETTMASRSFASWIADLRREGYTFHVQFFWLQSVELAVQRVRERVRAGGHAVPEDDVRRRYHRGIRNFKDLYQPLAATWAIYDNSRSSPVLIASGSDLKGPEIIQPDLWYKFIGA